MQTTHTTINTRHKQTPAATIIKNSVDSINGSSAMSSAGDTAAGETPPTLLPVVAAVLLVVNPPDPAAVVLVAAADVLAAVPLPLAVVPLTAVPLTLSAVVPPLTLLDAVVVAAGVVVVDAVDAAVVDAVVVDVVDAVVVDVAGAVVDDVVASVVVVDVVAAVVDVVVAEQAPNEPPATCSDLLSHTEPTDSAKQRPSVGASSVVPQNTQPLAASHVSQVVDDAHASFAAHEALLNTCVWHVALAAGSQKPEPVAYSHHTQLSTPAQSEHCDLLPQVPERGRSCDTRA